MTTKLPAALLIALIAVGCGGADKTKGNGASASSDTGLRRDTSGMTAPATTDTLADSSRTPGFHSDSVASPTRKKSGAQTQSGMTNKKGHSTLGPGIKQTRPDQSQPVTAKGDTLSPQPGVSTDSMNNRPSQMPIRRDTTPVPMDTTIHRPLSDTIPARDSTHTDSVPPNPVQPVQPVDSTHADTTQHKP